MGLKIWIAVFVVAVTYLVYALVTVDRRSDEARIRSLITDTAAAVQRRDLNGTIRCVSENFKDSSGLNHDRLRMLAAQTLRTESNFTVRADIQSLSIHGDDATMIVHAVVTTAAGSSLYDHDLTLNLRKERGVHDWITPVKVWRVVGAEGLTSVLRGDWGAF